MMRIQEPSAWRRSTFTRTPVSSAERVEVRAWVVSGGRSEHVRVHPDGAAAAAVSTPSTAALGVHRWSPLQMFHRSINRGSARSASASAGQQHPDISVSRFGQAVVGASSVVCLWIAEWGWSRQRVMGLW
jgi:hypothetical protein